MSNKPYVVAEACCNHMGDMDIALKMIQAAAACGADAVKFQKRNCKECLTEEQYNGPHPNARNSFGKTYGEHREFLEFTIDQHAILQKACKDSGVAYSTSVWDLTSAKQIAEQLNPPFIKVPSACNNNLVMLEYLRDSYEGDIHISQGMTTSQEQVMIRRTLYDISSRVVMYACTSGYPVPYEKVYLNEIHWLTANWPRSGFSGHHLGTAIDIAAYAMGADYIERHFTLDRTWKGSDQECSLDEEGLKGLVRDLHVVQAAMKFKPWDMDPLEAEQRHKLKYRPTIT